MKTKPSRDQNPHLRRNLIIFLSASIVIVVAGFFVIMVLYKIFFHHVSNPPYWSLLGDFTSVVSISLLIGGLTFALVEYIGKENAKHRANLAEEREKNKLSYDMYKAINEKFTAAEQEAARRWIFQNIQIKQENDNIDAWYEQTNARIMARKKKNNEELPEGQACVKMSLNCLDYIGFISEHYWKIEGDSLNWISGPVAKVWNRLGPYVEQVRTLRKAKDYYISAEAFGKLCVHWRKDKGLPDEEFVSNTL
jgi:hypothetical protein